MMSARVDWDGVERAYAAAAWVDCGLRTDGSLFTAGKHIWTRDLLGELHRRFLDRPDEGGGGFMEKLEVAARQMRMGGIMPDFPTEIPFLEDVVRELVETPRLQAA